jgi:uncharacterized membrane protein
MAQWELRSGTGVERLLFFSDAVVAVAITVLALPLISIAGPKPGQSVLVVLEANSGAVMTFVSTFFVVAIMWSIHNRVMNALMSYDGAIFWLNMCWLIGFVFLPWPAAMFAGGDDWGSENAVPFTSDGTGVLYWWTLAYISGVGTLAMAYISRHPHLLSPSSRAYWEALKGTRARFRGLAFFVVFIVAGLATLVFSYWGFYALVLVIPLNLALQPTRRERDRLAALEAGGTGSPDGH